jgi:hypothetical protein
MLVDIIEVKALEDYSLWLRFEDGTEGTVDVAKLIGKFTGVFSKIADNNVFKKVKVNKEIGTIEWPGDVDMCPDVLYAAVKQMPIPDLSESVA